MNEEIAVYLFGTIGIIIGIALCLVRLDPAQSFPLAQRSITLLLRCRQKIRRPQCLGSCSSSSG